MEDLRDKSGLDDPNSIPKRFEPSQVEKRLYEFWEKLGIFTPQSGSSKEKYVIVLPPPNVTGILHMGHALTISLEDILIRRKRMQGFNVLWLPGTDHAGIATQMVVERHLLKTEKKSRHDLGREKFLEKVWEWKEQSQNTIVGQLRLMGCSLDWTRLRFTLDEVASRAVREAFVRLFNDGLIYRATAMIQWCPRCHTALSDLEVKHHETKGHLWYIRYVLKDDPKGFITVATTRPETLLGDTAVAVNPKDSRFAGFKGKEVVLPLLKRVIPVIADEFVDPAFGTGALKITPGHDPNDAAIGERHGLAVISIFDESARLKGDVGPYAGLSREEARKKILADLEKEGLLEGEKPYVHSVGHCDRCSTMLEPGISSQWFVNAEVLAQDAIRAVETGEIRIIPTEWEKTYFEWMRNIRPWCISRQLWWGHRIPVWYCSDCGNVFSDIQDPSCCSKCRSTNFFQDGDVLDTWFSSGLWPFSTLGWPQETPDFKTFYPNSVMETGFDILFFWVARMIMLGKRMTGKFPFHTVYLHPMVRDESGQKMSKTKGNVKDPLEIISSTGADALRFTLAAMCMHGRDVLLSDSRIEGYRNFVNKIWNAARFVLMHFSELSVTNIDKTNPVNRWIWSRLENARKNVNEALEQYRFFEAADCLYHFVWRDYCDWFLEFIKVPEELEGRKKTAESTAVEVLEQMIRLAHPFMPFVTEELWQRLPLRGKVPSVALASYPVSDVRDVDEDIERRLGRVIEVIEAVRSKRGDNDVGPGAEISMIVQAEKGVLDQMIPLGECIQKMVKAHQLEFAIRTQTFSGNYVRIPLKDVEVAIPRGDLIDKKKELSKMEKEIEVVRGELSRATRKLKNQEFCERAPPEVVKGVKERRQVLENKLHTLQSYLEELKRWDSKE